MFQPQVSIVIPTYNRAEILRETLEHLARIDFPRNDFEVIVVNDGSTDNTAEVVNSFADKFAHLVLETKQNRSVARSRNLGARVARAENLIFLDDDILVQPDNIIRNLRNLEIFGRCIVGGHWEFSPKMQKFLESSVFGRYRLAVEEWVKEANAKTRLRDNCFEAMSISGQNFAMRKADFWEINGFDENFPFAGFEDHEFTQTALKAGFQLIYDYDIQLYNNDFDRNSIAAFADRQRRGAITKIVLAHKYPDEYLDVPLIIENAPLKTGEPRRLSAKKIAKRIVSSPPVLTPLIMLTETLDKVWRHPQIVGKLYDIIVGAYIFRGIRQGIAEYGEPKSQISDGTQNAASATVKPSSSQRFTVAKIK